PALRAPPTPDISAPHGRWRRQRALVFSGAIVAVLALCLFSWGFVPLRRQPPGPPPPNHLAEADQALHEGRLADAIQSFRLQLKAHDDPPIRARLRVLVTVSEEMAQAEKALKEGRCFDAKALADKAGGRIELGVSRELARR